MSRTRIKICGVRRPDDAVAAARAGADAVGIILHRAARRGVAVDVARAIVAVLPPYVTPVGLFVDSSADEVSDIARQLGLRHVQLHGDEMPEMAAAVGHLSVVKAIRVDRATIDSELAKWRTGPANVRGLVLETAHTGPAGGSGVANDWAFVRELIDRGAFDGLPSIVAAGGLHAGMVGDVIRTVRPWAVDVSSGVEANFGEKSATRIDEFVRAVTAADAEPSAG